MLALRPSVRNMFVLSAFLLFASERGAGMKALAAKVAAGEGFPSGQYQAAFANLRAIAVAASPALYSTIYSWLSRRGGAPRTYYAAALVIVAAELLHRSLPQRALDFAVAKSQFERKGR